MSTFDLSYFLARIVLMMIVSKKNFFQTTYSTLDLKEENTLNILLHGKLNKFSIYVIYVVYINTWNKII